MTGSCRAFLGPGLECGFPFHGDGEPRAGFSAVNNAAEFRGKEESWGGGTGGGRRCWRGPESRQGRRREVESFGEDAQSAGSRPCMAEVGGRAVPVFAA